MLIKKIKILTGVILIMTMILINFSGQKATAATQVNVKPSMTYQTMDGWGTNLAWWATQVGGWSQAKRTQIENLVFGADGLDLNIVRYNIGGGENPNCPFGDDHMYEAREMEGFQPSPGVWDWNADANQRKILLDAVNTYGVNFIEANANTAPYWMTVSGCAAGAENSFDDNLDPNYYDEFADYLIEVTKHYRDSYGIEFTSLTPLNEPVSGYWKAGGTQEGCQFNVASQEEILQLVDAKLKANSLSSTQLVASDETSIDQAYNTYTTMSDTTKNIIHRVNTHSYTGSNRFRLADLMQSENKKLWMSEYSTGYLSHDHNGIDPALPLANVILKDVKDMGASAWVIWQAVESEKANLMDETTLQAYDPAGSWGLIHGVYSDFTFNGSQYKMEDFWMTKQYYVMKQFSQFIKEGYTIIDVNDSNTLAAFDKTSGKVVLVVVNQDNYAKAMNYNLSEFDQVGSSVNIYRTSETEACQFVGTANITNGTLSYTLDAKSVTTLVLDNCSYDGKNIKRINDQVIGNSMDQIVYQGNGWGYWNEAYGSFKDDHSFSKTAGDSATITFFGTDIEWYGSKANNQGMADVYIDNSYVETVDTYSSSRVEGALLYAVSNLSDAQHELKLVVKNSKNQNSSDYWVSVDSFHVFTDNYNHVVNGEFEVDNSTQNPYGWLEWNSINASYTQPGGVSGNMECVHWASDAYDVATYQMITDLSNGTYQLSAWVRSSGDNSMAYLEARDFNGSGDSKSIAIPDQSTYTKIFISDIQVTNGQILINFRSSGNGGNWITFDEVELIKTN